MGILSGGALLFRAKGGVRFNPKMDSRRMCLQLNQTSDK